MTGKILVAYFLCLDGNVPGFEVYKNFVSADEKGNYILIRAEGESDRSDKNRFANSTTIIVDLVSRHKIAADLRDLEVADIIVRDLIFPTRKTLGLQQQAGLQILNVTLADVNYQDGYDGSEYEYRKILRFTNHINLK